MRLRTFLRTFFPTAPRPQNKFDFAIEPLEARIAPATLLSPTTVTFQDADGDMVTVKTSKAVFTSANVNQIFTFNTGSVSGDNNTPQQLQLIDLTKANASGLSGMDLKINVVKAAAGDGEANIGYIRAPGLSLGQVSVKGDLGRIDCGLATSVSGLKSLHVNSLGVEGIASQAAGGNLSSTIIGSLGLLSVAGDFKNATLSVISGGTQSIGKIGSINIDGSLIGGSAVSSGLIAAADSIGAIKIGSQITGGTTQNSGAIRAAGKIASVTVGGGIQGNDGAFSGSITSGTNPTLNGDIGAVKIGADLQGGTGPNSGQINSSGKIASVMIGGSLHGSGGNNSGEILSVTSMGPVTIKHDVQGGAGTDSGEIFSNAGIGTINIGGSLLGGTNSYSGFISAGTDIGLVKITGNITGAGFLDSGTIIAAGKIAGLNIGGSLAGGAGENSGSVFSGTNSALLGNMGAVVISGDIHGGGGPNSGQIHSGGNLVSVAISKGLIGGDGVGSGAISSAGSMGAVSVKLNVQGGNLGADAGQISSGAKLGAVTIGGSLLGGAAENSGAILSHTQFGSESDIEGSMGMVKISGEMKGGLGSNSGQINAAGALAGVVIGQSLTGGSSNGSGVILSGTDFITSGAMGAVKIGGDLKGGDVSGSASLDESGYIEGQRIASITIQGSLIAGTNAGSGSLSKSGSIRAVDDLGSITVKNSIVGNASNAAIIAARGQAIQTGTDLAIKKISVTKDVNFATILGGYDPDLLASNADAQIGSLKIGGNWMASSAVTGVVDSLQNGFGNADDARISISSDNASIVSEIASIIIGGNISGTAGSGDHFGFVAQQIGALKFNGSSVVLHAGGMPDVIDPLGATTDVSLREIV